MSDSRVDHFSTKARPDTTRPGEFSTTFNQMTPGVFDRTRSAVNLLIGKRRQEYGAGKLPNMRRHLLVVSTLAICACIMLAGCTTKVSGTASTPSSASGNTLGDTLTLDPCSLVDTNDLTSYGQSFPMLGTKYEECDIYVRAPSSKPGTTEPNDEPTADLIISFDNLTSPTLISDATKARTKQQGDLRYTTAKTYTADKNQQHCAASITFPDNTWISFDANPSISKADKTCVLVDKAVQSGLKVIQQGKLKHQAHPKNLWASQNYCQLLDDSAFSKVPNVNIGTKTFFPGSHSCYWGSSIEQLNKGPIPTMVSMDLILADDNLNRTADSDKQYLTQVNGKTILLKPFAASSDGGVQYPPTCKAKAWGQKVRDKSPADSNGPTYFEQDEVTDIYVYSELPDSQRCDLAKSLMTQVLSKLPAAS